MQDGSKEPPTKPKGRPKKNSVPSFAEIQKMREEGKEKTQEESGSVPVDFSEDPDTPSWSAMTLESRFAIIDTDDEEDEGDEEEEEYDGEVEKRLASIGME
ncbi:hypothetical protein SK128_026146, partial [Halocaridina rubra]